MILIEKRIRVIYKLVCRMIEAAYINKGRIGFFFIYTPLFIPMTTSYTQAKRYLLHFYEHYDNFLHQTVKQVAYKGDYALRVSLESLIQKKPNYFLLGRATKIHSVIKSCAPCNRNVPRKKFTVLQAVKIHQGSNENVCYPAIRLIIV